MIALSDTEEKGVNPLFEGEGKVSLVLWAEEGQRGSDDPLCRISDAATGRLPELQEHGEEPKSCIIGLRLAKVGFLVRN